MNMKQKFKEKKELLEAKLPQMEVEVQTAMDMENITRKAAINKRKAFQKMKNRIVELQELYDEEPS